MKTEKLTKIERLQLSNQFRILHKLTDDETYAINAEIVENGYEGLYYKLFEPIFDGVSKEVCEETMAILHMYRVINNAIATLPPQEQAQIDSEKIKFEGFDGNNDDHYHYMSFLVEEMDMWQEYAEASLNSHSSITINKYRKMLEVYQLLGGNRLQQYNVGELLQFQNAL
jgi:uncharacterized protein